MYVCMYARCTQLRCVLLFGLGWVGLGEAEDEGVVVVVVGW